MRLVDGIESCPEVQVDDGVCLYRYKQASLSLVSAEALRATADNNELGNNRYHNSRSCGFRIGILWCQAILQEVRMKSEYNGLKVAREPGMGKELP